jgi:radical SAM superfamily enzyme YgiQ (UPF0313 family)
MSIWPDKPTALLINPPIYDFSLYDLFHKPLGLMRIGRWLEDAGYLVPLINALDICDERSRAALGAPKRKGDGTGKFFKQNVSFPVGGGAVKRRYARYGIVADSFASRIGETKPDIVLITTGMTYWYPGVVEAVRAVRKQHPGVPVVVGGVYATLLPEHCEKTAEPDFVVSGDPWGKLKDILSAYRLPVPAGTPGRRVLLIEDLWRDAGVLRLNEGCPMKCDYCASSLLYPGFLSGDADDSFAVLSELVKSCHISSVGFYDDALLFNKEESLKPFLEKVIESGLKMSFYLPNAVHLGLLDPETASLMRRAGFREVRLGYESSSVSFHEHHDSKVQGGDFEEAVEVLLGAGFRGAEVIAYILAGLPGQRAEEVENTVRHTASLGVRASLAEYSPVPGTRLWQASIDASRYPIEEEPLFQNNSVMAVQWDGFTPGDLQRLKNLSRKLSPSGA